MHSMDTAHKPKLRIGLLVNSLTQPAWVHRIVSQIAASDIAEVVLVVTNEAGSPRSRQSKLKTLLDNRHHILRKLYTTLDDRLFKTTPDPFEPMSLEPLLGDCPRLGVTPRQTKYSDYFSKEEVEAIRTHDLDVAFRFGFRILRGKVLDIARHGVWSYHHGDNLAMRGGPAGFWEVMEGHPATGSILQVLTPRLDDGKVLYRSWSSTMWFSVQRNKANYYWKTAAFAMRKLYELHEDGPDALGDDPHAATYQPYARRIYRPPTNARMLRLLAGLGGRLVRRGFQKIGYRNHWLLAYKLTKDNSITQSFNDMQVIRSPKDRFWADPYPVKNDGRYYIFFEELEYKTNKGWISVIEMNDEGNWQPAVKVLEEPYHLSHPFLFEWQGVDYMIPETRGSEQIRLYRCTSFPDQWEFDRVLMENVRAIDVTLAEVDGRWWMYTNIAEEGVNTNDELYLFHADSPLGPWQPHKRNPVKSDVRSARPAGGLFRWGGELYRPAQDSALNYGHAISIHQVLEITPDTYREQEVAKILPDWHPGITRNHTLNHADGLTVIDAFLHRRRWF